MSRILSLIITLLFLSAGLILGVLNPAIVPFDVFWAQIEIPLSLLLAIAVVIGMLLAGFYAFSQLIKLKWELRRSEKNNKKQMDEIIRLKKDILDLQKKQPESADASTSLEMLSKP